MTATAQTVGRSRAARPGSGRAWILYPAVLVVLLGVLAYGIYGYVSRGDARTVRSANGPLADRLLIGTYSSPAITVSGDTVKVETPSFTADAVVTGPQVPGEGFIYQPQAVVATWTVHIYDVRGTIPISAADFDTTDFLGKEFRLLPPSGTVVPKSVNSGGSVTFELRSDVPIGENLFRWAPNGNNIVAKWDNQVEND